MKEYKIYGLVCPLGNVVRYIGYTSLDIDVRLKQHIRDVNRKTYTHKTNWLRKLKSMNLYPTIIILYDKLYCVEDACEYEVQFIKEYKEKGFNLTNSTEGGEISKIFSNDVIEKISISVKKYYETHIHWNKGRSGVYITSEETKKKLSLRNGGENNGMYNKTIKDVWSEKYGEEESNNMFKEWSNKKKKYDYDYNKLYDMLIIQKMTQRQISKEIGISTGQLCRVIKKYNLKNKKEI